MPRPTAKIRQDDVKRAVRAVTDCGLPIKRIEFHGEIFKIILQGEDDAVIMDQPPGGGTSCRKVGM